MLDDMNSFDFFKEVPSLQLPVLFIHGGKEKHVMPELIQKYSEQLDAPEGKPLLWADKSSHAFHIDDPRGNERRLIAHLTRKKDLTHAL
ncbi:alpha/beta hydrolase [Bacillus sp. FJAT-49711]|uniref:alpha/beta fold hydrolase n=1 Tax=Bacillus sp. FJAT-49711 TaxID=2833585 RepID=UPI001BC9975B|nr:alpha/beta hydrolase [Bacillus sp. FJAT-49711]MBS4218543.1 alpha/beta hydrolase [Bacillus sp. FJAT-49711]